MVGIIPFNDNPLTRVNTPTKFFEYMATASNSPVEAPDGTAALP